MRAHAWQLIFKPHHPLQCVVRGNPAAGHGAQALKQQETKAPGWDHRTVPYMRTAAPA